MIEINPFIEARVRNWCEAMEMNSDFDLSSFNNLALAISNSSFFWTSDITEFNNITPKKNRIRKKIVLRVISVEEFEKIFQRQTLLQNYCNKKMNQYYLYFQELIFNNCKKRKNNEYQRTWAIKICQRKYAEHRKNGAYQ